MNWLRDHRQSAALVGLTLLLPAALLLFLLGKLWAVRSDSAAEIEHLAPRIARLSGLASSEEALGSASGQVESLVADLAYPAGADRAAIAAELQREIRQVVSEAGLEIRNSQVLPSREVGGLDYLTVKLRAGGDLAALDNALSQIEDFRPMLLVEALDVSPVRETRRRKAITEKQALTVNLQLVSLRITGDSG